MTALVENDCVNISGAGEDVSVSKTDCSAPHDAQVFFVATLDEPSTYSADGVEAAAEDACLFMFWDFAGEHYYQSELDARWLVPSEQTWAAGERTAVCLVQSPDGQVTGTLRAR